MIHLVTRLPLSYHRTLCRTLHDSYNGAFVAWFAEKSSEDFPLRESTVDRYQYRFLSESGYAQFFHALKNDPEAVVILGGWSSPMTNRTLLMTTLLRIPVFIWADHPHPRNRTWINNRVRRIYLRLFSKLVAGFLACGRPTVKHLKLLGIPANQITEFPYWVDVPKLWSPPNGCEASGTEIKPLRLLAVGRLVSIKQFEVAIRATSLVNQRCGQTVVQLALVGDGPERQNLAALAKSLRCEDAVSFCGRLEGDDLDRQFERADVLVLPSRFDAYGVVVLEALARGRPVLASEGVVAALDRDDGSGAVILHPAGNAECLAQQIERFANDRDELRHASFAARMIAERWRPQRAASILDALLATTTRGAALIQNRSEVTTAVNQGPETRTTTLAASQ